MDSIDVSGPLPSPARTHRSPSVSNTETSNFSSSTGLPTPRSHPLKPDGSKFMEVRFYLDKKLLRIQQRYVKRFPEFTHADSTPGYGNYDEIVTDIDPLINLVWESGTPGIQVPYLLELGGLMCEYLPKFAFSTSFFRLCKKFDYAFSTLVKSATDDVRTSRTVSQTVIVRIKSLALNTRNAAAAKVSEAGFLSQPDYPTDDDDSEEEEELGLKSSSTFDSNGVLTQLSQVYEATIGLVGSSLEDMFTPTPGAPSDEPAPCSTEVLEL